MPSHIVYFNGTSKVTFKSEEDVLCYLIDNGYFIKNKEFDSATGDILYYLKGQNNDWKVIKNHYQKLKEIPGYAEKWYNEQLQKDELFVTDKLSSDMEKAFNAIPHYNDPAFDDEWDEDDEDDEENYEKAVESLWGEDFANFLNSEIKKTSQQGYYKAGYAKKAKKKTGHNKQNQIYYIYDKGKLAQKKRFSDLTELSNHLEERQAFIVAMKTVSEKTTYVWVVDKEDIVRFLPDKMIIKRFEQIFENKVRGFDLEDDNPYEHIEL